MARRRLGILVGLAGVTALASAANGSLSARAVGKPTYLGRGEALHWAAGGRKIAFWGDNNTLWMMRSDGTGKTKVAAADESAE